RSFERSGHLVLTALVVSGRTETAARPGFQRNAGQKSVERQVEVEPGLLAIGDHVESGSDLVVHRGGNGVVKRFGQIVLTELIHVQGEELKPGRKRIAANYRCAQLHETVQPPSTLTTWPVMWRDWSPRRNSAVRAMSAASNMPALNGCLWATKSRSPVSDC